MKTLSHRYTGKQDLLEFIEINEIQKNRNNLLQIFTGVSDVKFIESLLSEVKDILPDIKIIGSTTSGEIMNADVLEKSTIFSFSLFQKTRVTTHIQELSNDSYISAKKLIYKFEKMEKAKVAITFTDGLSINAESYLKAFKEHDEKLIVAGGLAGDNADFKQTIVFNESEVLTHGAVVALLYNNKLQVNTGAVYGWKKIGKILTITKAKDNVVYEIDGIKAIDIYFKYLGDKVARELPKTGIEFPLIIKRDDIDIARAVLGKNSDGSLIFAGHFNVGDKVTFSYANTEIMLNDAHQVSTDIATNPIESIFIYSCMARKALLHSNIVMELEMLNSIVPISGFFTCGEFYCDVSSNKFNLLNQTMTILSLSENENCTSEFKAIDKSKYSGYQNNTLNALSHLISQTTKELKDMNISLSNKVEEEVAKNREKEQQLIEQSRLAQMGEMLSMIAHQWRQPLSAISSTSASLELRAKLGKLENSVVVDRANNISKYAQHLSATIDDFRDFFKMEKEKEEISYSEIIESVLGIVETSIENKNIAIVKEIKVQDRFYTYKNELKQVILNLLINAEDALLEKSKRLGELSDELYIKIHVYNKDDKHVLEIIDNGEGIPKDIIPKIFDPYFSTKLEKNGTGLGLYMGKIIIEEHCCGTLSVSSNDYGTIFKIELDFQKG